MRDATCATCQFFQRLAMLSPQGSCNRFPPVVIQGKNGQSIFPLVLQGDSCGEYRLRGERELTR